MAVFKIGKGRAPFAASTVSTVKPFPANLEFEHSLQSAEVPGMYPVASKIRKRNHEVKAYPQKVEGKHRIARIYISGLCSLPEEARPTFADVGRSLDTLKLQTRTFCQG